ncbi:hypothetical protein Asp14428_65620 [Actinoplanes sp. NBRC 14428]|nr:hypothetical protein Asp14428_65620 [Actinoplanes sp. NBRC 14428]
MLDGREVGPDLPGDPFDSGDQADDEGEDDAQPEGAGAAALTAALMVMTTISTLRAARLASAAMPMVWVMVSMETMPRSNTAGTIQAKMPAPRVSRK